MKISRMAAKRLTPYLLGTVLGALVSIGALLLLALIMYIMQLPSSLVPALGLTALGAGAFASGLFLGKVKRRRGLVLGTKAGLILLGLCLAGSLISGGLNGTELAGKGITVLATGVTGGVLGVNSKEKL